MKKFEKAERLFLLVYSAFFSAKYKGHVMGGKGGCSDTPKAKNGGSNGNTTDLNSALGKSSSMDLNSSGNVSEDDSVPGKPSTVDLNSSGDESIVRQYDSDDDSVQSPGLKSPKVSSKKVPSEHSGNSSDEENLVRPPAKKQRDS